MTVRFAVPQDAQALLEIYRPYVEHTTITFETEVPTLEEFRSRIAAISAAFPYLVAEENGMILGYAYAHPFHERSAFRWTVETSVYVRQEARGRHVGTVLYRALLPLLEAQGVQTACAVITIPNDPSIGFHRAMGFTQEGLLRDVGFKLGVWRSVAYLCLRFSPERATPPPLRSIHELPPELVRKFFSEAAEIS